MTTKLKGLLPQLSQRQYIAIFKGVLAYVLAFVLIFLRKFNKTNDYPVTLTSAILVTIAGKPGISVGACLDNGALGIAGVGFGAVIFVIMAKLGNSQVAQGFVFFIFLYLLALVKAQSLRYFAFSLLAIIMGFSGIYTSILLGGVFSPTYLESYLESYCWGFAIVLGVNILILPITSERELRQFLVLSLEHVSTFSHLIAKTYLVEISDEEKAVRDQLNQSIRSDMALLMQKMSEVGLEVNYTRWSMSDYATVAAKIRNMQQGLITSYSSLIAMERHDIAALKLIKAELMDCGTDKAFGKLRRGSDLAIADIVKEFAVGKQIYHSPAPGSRSWDDFVDIETSSTSSESQEEETVGDLPSRAPMRPRGLSRGLSQMSQHVIETRLDQVSERLRKEVENMGPTPVGSRRGSVSEGEKDDGTTAVPSVAPPRKKSDEETITPGRVSSNSAVQDKVVFLRDSWSSFEKAQNESVTRMLASGVSGDDELILHSKGPSLHEMFANPPPGLRAWSTALAAAQGHTHVHKRKHHIKTPTNPMEDAAAEGAGAQMDASEEESDAFAEICSTTIMRVYSFLFGMGKTVDQIASLHEFVVPKPGTTGRTKGIHFHWFESIPKAPKPDKATTMSFPDAYREVTGKDLAVAKATIWTRLAKLEKLARSDTSIYAFKTACAVSVYTVFILAPSLKTFFVNYGLTGGLITIVVAMAPTLGQTFLTFVLQILGTGFGSLYGMVILYIFRHVGGYFFNPYGLICMLALYAIPMCYIIYIKPMFFAGGLLAMNGTGSLIITQWVYREVPGFIRPEFDNPGYPKALVAMSLALGIAGIFQIFILRTPARQTLRVKLAELTFSLAGYNVLLSGVMEAMAPTMPRAAPVSQAALKAVEAELIAREGKIQMDLLGLMPLLKFGAAEPSFGVPFQGEPAGVIARIIRTNQIILDRLREARTAIGTEGFGPEIREAFIDRLTPYRRQSRRFSRALFYLCATSLATKTPLPHELPSMSGTARMIQHDAMILSYRLTKSEEGLAILHSSNFLKYWFYLVSYSSISFQLEAMETDLRILFGDVDLLTMHASH